MQIRLNSIQNLIPKPWLLGLLVCFVLGLFLGFYKQFAFLPRPSFAAYEKGLSLLEKQAYLEAIREFEIALSEKEVQEEVGLNQAILFQLAQARVSVAQKSPLANQAEKQLSLAEEALLELLKFELVEQKAVLAMGLLADAERIKRSLESRLLEDWRKEMLAKPALSLADMLVDLEKRALKLEKAPVLDQKEQKRLFLKRKILLEILRQKAMPKAKSITPKSMV